MFWKKRIKEVLKELNTDAEFGLTEEEASLRLKQNGLNELPTTKVKKWYHIALGHLIEPFMFVLFALLAIVSYFQEYKEMIVIILIIIIDTSLSTFQETKAISSLESLKKLVTKETIVIREGKKYVINVKNLVVGDLIVLDAGMFIPADARISQSFHLQTDESILTGESTLIDKSITPIKSNEVVIGDRFNMVFMSTIIVAGSGLAIVTAIGSNTEIGKTTALMQQTKSPRSPLKKQMNFLIRIISILALIMGVVVFLIQYFAYGKPVQDSIIFSIALAVAVIPEGLLVIVTVSLSLGSQRMAKKNAIMKDLTAVETIGQVSVICSDKTGTLTENKMTVQKFFLKNKIQLTKTLQLETEQDRLFLNCLVLANNGQINEEGKALGDPTETALLVFAETCGVISKDWQESMPRVYEYPFDSQRKLMSTVNPMGKKTMLFTKGAPDNLINLCTHILIDNKKVALTEKLKQPILKAIHEMSNQALRVLGTAYKQVKAKQDFNKNNNLESDLTFLGLVGMIDPPRKEVKEVLQTTLTAGITTKMITGDHINTAVAVGKELGLVKDKSQTIEGQELKKLSDVQLAAKITDLQVFARVSPDDKVRIVKALQAKDLIVAMTGDGVNDAPSLKTANIGISMGKTGTDVAKDAAQVILTDDNFLTIISAVEEGRNIYNKLKRIICFVLITNFSQVLAILLGIAFQFGAILTPLQVLWINLIVESILAITMTMGPNNPKLMRSKPTNKKDHILKGSVNFIIFVSLILSSLLILSYYLLPMMLQFAQIPANKTALTFIIMVNAPIFYSLSFSLGRHESLFNKMIFQNKPFLFSVVLSLVLNIILIFTPVVNSAFGVEQEVPPQIYLICLAIALIPTVALEINKWARHKWDKRKNKNKPIIEKK